MSQVSKETRKKIDMMTAVLTSHAQKDSYPNAFWDLQEWNFLVKEVLEFGEDKDAELRGLYIHFVVQLAGRETVTTG